MSQTMTIPRRQSGSLGLRVLLCASRLIAKLPPARLQSVMTRLSRSTQAATPGQLLHWHDRVVTANARMAGWRGCLPRSIAVCLLARRSGQWPDRWCAGVRMTAPFAAHAWVETQGTVVGESAPPDHYRAVLSAMVA